MWGQSHLLVNKWGVDLTRFSAVWLRDRRKNYLGQVEMATRPLWLIAIHTGVTFRLHFFVLSEKGFCFNQLQVKVTVIWRISDLWFLNWHNYVQIMMLETRLIRNDSTFDLIKTVFLKFGSFNFRGLRTPSQFWCVFLFWYCNVFN
jgi:hypothetical protein